MAQLVDNDLLRSVDFKRESRVDLFRFLNGDSLRAMFFKENLGF